MMTKLQAALYAFIRDYGREHGVGPSFDEMQEALAISRGSVGRLVNSLEERGMIRRLRYRARAIEVIPQSSPVIYRDSGRTHALAPEAKEPGVGELYVRARAEKPPPALYVNLKPRTW